MARPIQYRPPELVLGILDFLLEEETAVAWDDVLERFATPELHWRTVERTLYDLMQFGAIHRIGKPAVGRRQADTRAVKVTDLGRAWLDQEVLPLIESE